MAGNHRDDGRDFYLSDRFESIERVPYVNNIDSIAKMAGIFVFFLTFCVVVAAIVVF